MHLFNNNQWKEDLDKTITILPELDSLANKSVFITGAAGLICSAVVDVLCRYNDTHGANSRIYVAGRSVAKMEARFQMERPDLNFVPYDASKSVNDLGDDYDYIIHGANK